jgi:hypothetical protein
LFGWDVQRAVQYNGNAGDSDLIIKQVPEIFVECKRVQSLNLSKAMEIAVSQAGKKLPLIFHRKDREEWMVTLPLKDLLSAARILATAARATQPELSEAGSESATT